MKKLLASLILLISSVAQATPSDYYHWVYFDSFAATPIQRQVWMADDGAPCVMVNYDLINPKTRCSTFGSGISYSAGVISVTGSQIQSDYTQSNTAAADYIKNKPALSAVALSGSYTDLTNKPTIPVINRAVVTTATNGTYTWTLPTACPSGQLPIVSITPEDSSATTVINPKVTAKTNTTVTIQAMRTEQTAVALLGLTILTIPGTAVASTLHLMATCP